MKERPILFSDEMVRAILEGRKTQTRRVLTGVPEDADEVFFWTGEPHYPKNVCAPFGFWARKNTGEQDGDDPEGYLRFLYPSRWGVPGDRLWVREAFHTDESDLATARAQHEDFMSPSPIFYRATEERENPHAGWRWRPSIHMPRWASRILLEVKDIRAERLQAITIEDAVAEGVPTKFGEESFAPVERFQDLWDSINGERNGGKYAWEKNPWVAAVTFALAEAAKEAA